jgi:hypothetical protein
MITIEDSIYHFTGKSEESTEIGKEYMQLAEWLKELVEYRRNSRGLTLEHVDVGDRVYYLCGRKVFEKMVTGYRKQLKVRDGGEHWTEDWFVLDFDEEETFSPDRIGKDIFLSKDEAEAKLKRKKNDDD